MLNRTNRTLSANLNRLYLGTRSLVLGTNETNGKLTLRARHAHVDFPRVVTSWSHDPSSISDRPGAPITSVPSSSAVVPWPLQGPLVDPMAVAPIAMPRPAFRPECAFGTTGQGGETQSQSRPRARSTFAEHATATKRVQSLKRDGRPRRTDGLYPGINPARAARPAAAYAAAGG